MSETDKDPPPFGEPPRPAILEYERPDLRITRFEALARVLGGWRRRVLIAGLAMVLGGLGDCLNPHGEGSAFMAVGGALIGLVIPLGDKQ